MRKREAELAIRQVAVELGDDARYLGKDPGDVLLAVVGDADAILQRLKARASEGDVTGVEFQLLAHWIGLVSRVAGQAMDAGVQRRAVAAWRAEVAAAVARFLTEVTSAVLAEKVAVLLCDELNVAPADVWGRFAARADEVNAALIDVLGAQQAALDDVLRSDPLAPASRFRSAP